MPYEAGGGTAVTRTPTYTARTSGHPTTRRVVRKVVPRVSGHPTTRRVVVRKPVIRKPVIRKAVPVRRPVAVKRVVPKAVVRKALPRPAIVRKPAPQPLRGVSIKTPAKPGAVGAKKPVSNILPYDPAAETEKRNLLGRKQTALAGFQRQRQDLNESSATALQRLQEDEPDVYRRLLSQYAGRGLAYSSGYGTSQGELGAQFARQRSDVERQKTTGLARINQSQSDYLTELDRLLAELQISGARNLTSRAGKLGL